MSSPATCFYQTTTTCFPINVTIQINELQCSDWNPLPLPPFYRICVLLKYITILFFHLTIFKCCFQVNFYNLLILSGSSGIHSAVNGSVSCVLQSTRAEHGRDIKKTNQNIFYLLFNRLGVARAVLSTASSFIHSFIHSFINLLSVLCGNIFTAPSRPNGLTWCFQ